MSDVATEPVEKPVEKPVRLTKKGVPRKPHVMTPKRIEAFEKCAAARKEKLAERKKETTKI